MVNEPHVQDGRYGFADTMDEGGLYSDELMPARRYV